MTYIADACLKPRVRFKPEQAKGKVSESEKSVQRGEKNIQRIRREKLNSGPNPCRCCTWHNYMFPYVS